MRIVTISDDVSLPSGLGVQHRIVAEALAGLGELTAFGFWNDHGHRDMDGYLAHGLGQRGLSDLAMLWPLITAALEPDLVVTVGDLRMFLPVASCQDTKGRVLDWKKQGDFTWAMHYYVDSPTFEFAYRDMIEQMDLVVTPSLFGAGVVKAYMPQVSMAVIPAAVDTELFVPVDEARKAALRDQWAFRLDAPIALRDRRILLYVDTNMFRKDTYLPIRALRELPDDVVLIMHCSMHPRSGSRGWRLDDLAEYYGVQDRVLFTSTDNSRPRMSRAEMAQLYQIADLRVSATQGEGFGVPIIEAGACGVPSVITLVGPTPEVIGGDLNCLARVAHWDVQQEGNMERAKVNQNDFVGKIRWHLEHPIASRKIGMDIREHVLRNFTVPAVQAAWRDAMTKLLGGESDGRSTRAANPVEAPVRP